jgi:protein-S-isoprenylcysteine O-methyltransferase Ste14
VLLLRTAVFTAQWLFANAVVWLVADGKALVQNPRGAVLMLTLNVLWVVPIIGAVYVPETEIKRRSKTHCYQLWMAALLFEIVVCALEFTRVRINRPVFEWSSVAGIGLITLGFLVSLAAWLNIRRYSAPEFQVLRDHKLVDYGLYRHVRHPIYSGFFLIGIGLPVLVESVAGFLVFVAVVMPVWTYVMSEEEQFLVAELGADYARYVARTKRLLPFVY